MAKQRGFTYLMLLWWVAISGVMLAAMAQSWSIESKRLREQELVFRGEQISAALRAYHARSPGAAKAYPAKLSDLLEDQRSGRPLHHLRRLWPDPITNSPDWGLLKEGGQIIGVFSRSAKAPLAAPAGIKSYEEWVFTADAAPAPQATPASGAASEAVP
jgi:type II secretory pathway pseudopilin PulG